MDEYYMARCLELAGKGIREVAPNPMVGCVIVHEDRIIGEGYHRAFGEAHAEVNAISSVKDPRLLEESTLYVNLEPCAHTGKTPACSGLIFEKKIPKVIVGTRDPNPLVAGKGLHKMEEKGLELVTGVLESGCIELNRRFFTFHKEKRPWILLKWARTLDGFIDRKRQKDDPKGVNWITGIEARQWVHKWRSEEQAILVGSRTALLDDPELTVRLWEGRDPLRIVIDREGKLPGNLKLFSGDTNTLVFTSNPKKGHGNTHYILVPAGADYIAFVLRHLYDMEIQSLMVEGGAELINLFIQSGLWDEARVFTGNKRFEEGIPSPELKPDPIHQVVSGNDRLDVYRNS